MSKYSSGSTYRGIWRNGLRLFPVTAMALILALTIPAQAKDRVVKSKVAPTYPEIAKRLKIAGVVKIEAKVDPEGKVGDLKTISGNPVLSPAAEDAVRQWRFAPADAASTEELEIHFVLAQ